MLFLSGRTNYEIGTFRMKKSSVLTVVGKKKRKRLLSIRKRLRQKKKKLRLPTHAKGIRKERGGGEPVRLHTKGKELQGSPLNLSHTLSYQFLQFFFFLCGSPFFFFLIDSSSIV